MKIVFEIGGGSNSLRKTVNWPMVPRVGDHVDLAEEWCSEPVSAVLWRHDGKAVHVRLRVTITEEHLVNLPDAGWKRR